MQVDSSTVCFILLLFPKAFVCSALKKKIAKKVIIIFMKLRLQFLSKLPHSSLCKKQFLHRVVSYIMN